jgi:CRISPR type I-E-associated protein CasB/Cse2
VTADQRFSAVGAWHRALLSDRGARAAIRRANGPLAFALIPAFHRLSEALRAAGANVKPPVVAQIAGVLAEIGADSQTPLGRALHQGAVSEARLRRLVHSQGRDELCDQLRSLARRLRALNVAETVETIVYWGERRASQVAQDFFSRGTEEAEASARCAPAAR